jgi:peptide/nickel transport system substrate-binding protein
MKQTLIFIIISALLLLIGCEGTNEFHNQIIIGIDEDVESFNPLYSFKVNEGRISELLFLSLVKHNWDKENSIIESEPMLAESIVWTNDSLSIIIKLRDNVFWSDGKPVTANDVVFSFDAYSHPDVRSKFFGSFKNFETDSEDHIIIEKAFEIISDKELIIHFKVASLPSLYDIDMPIIPAHTYKNINFKDFETADINFNPITNGPYFLVNWKRNNSIELKLNKSSHLVNDKSVEKIIFKVIPDYNARITQLKKNEIDFIELVNPDDADRLKNENSITIDKVIGREYDYIGWNNIDSKSLDADKIVPNKLFGSSKVRKALTHAINRKVILDEYLFNFGMLAISPVTPIFKNSYDFSIPDYSYNPKLASKLLEDEGWIDTDHDGILEKENQEFKFDLNIPSGNPRRTYAATVIKNNLKTVGIDVSIKSHELGQFIDNLYDRKMDAWMAAWYVPIPIELKVYWYSKLESAPLNFPAYKNSRIDIILQDIESNIPEENKINLLKEFQKIIHEDQPVTFLYWVDNIIAYNNKVKNININPLGAIHDCWEWSIEE